MVFPSHGRESNLIDSRVRVLALVLLSIAHGAASSRVVPVLTLITVVTALLYKNSFMRGVMIIGVGAATLGIFTLVVWVITVNLTLSELLVGYLRWVSLMTLSVVLFLSLDTLEMVAGLVRFRVPVRVAMALGVGLRFLPVLYEEARRVLMIQRHRGVAPSWGAFRRYGLLGILSRMSSPLLVSVLRRVDSLNLSIAIQQLEYRIERYQFPPWRFRDWMALATIFVLFIMAVLG